MRAAAPVTAAIEKLGWPATLPEVRDEVFKVLVDLYDIGFNDGADWMAEVPARPHLEVVIGLDANGDYEYAPCHMDCVNPLLDEEECDGWD